MIRLLPWAWLAPGEGTGPDQGEGEARGRERLVACSVLWGWGGGPDEFQGHGRNEGSSDRWVPWAWDHRRWVRPPGTQAAGAGPPG